MSDSSQTHKQSGDHSKALLGVVSYSEAQNLRSRLAKEGIEVALIHNQATCSSGCSVKVEVWAHPTDLGDIEQILASDHAQTLAGLNYDPRLLEQVYDPSAPSAVCPACSTEFSSSLSTCPDCGLCFDLPNQAPASGGCGPKGCK